MKKTRSQQEKYTPNRRKHKTKKLTTHKQDTTEEKLRRLQPSPPPEGTPDPHHSNHDPSDPQALKPIRQDRRPTEWPPPATNPLELRREPPPENPSKPNTRTRRGTKVEAQSLSRPQPPPHSYRIPPRHHRPRAKCLDHPSRPTGRKAKRCINRDSLPVRRCAYSPRTESEQRGRIAGGREASMKIRSN
ncbi:hypothetical protein STAS_10610 [Striga asiatica]|uniref:Uncharacterized protein n=1 Tax=Striga asiatica TaxID=4170 RepID=A0A5A7PPJ1_STRAF|nr:hypothetical protein STAS_10610 [Striga asiatica]